MKKEELFIGIDVGTTKIKVAVIDIEGREICVFRKSSKVISSEMSRSEINMDDLWQDTLETLKKACSDSNVSKKNIVGIGVSGTAGGAYLINGEGVAIRDGIMWNDARNVKLIEKFQETNLYNKIFDITGNAVFPGYSLSVLNWLSKNEPEILEKTRWTLCQKDWINFKLTGKIYTEESDLSYMPCDIIKRSYSDELFEIFEIGEYKRLFPPIAEPFSVIGKILPNIAKYLGLSPDVEVATGFVDVVASTVGSGAVSVGQSCSIVGTSCLNSVITEKSITPPRGIGITANYPNGLWLRSLVNTSGTINIDWFLDKVCSLNEPEDDNKGTKDFKKIEERIKKIPVGSKGLIYHPYINKAGVFSPFVNPTARAQFFGLSIEHDKYDIIHSIYEGVALAILDCYDHIPVNIDEVIITGGAAQSSFWCQMISNSLAKSVIVTEGTEIGAKGVAILSGVTSGVYSNLMEGVKRAVKIKKKYLPNIEKSKKYRKLLTLYRSIYKHLNEDWWKRHKLLESLSGGN